MTDTPDPPVPGGENDRLSPIRPDAPRLAGVTRRGRRCVLIDNTGAGLPREDLRAILDALIEQDRFGLALLSASGGNTLDLERRESGHVQIGAQLYRLLLHRYTARIEPF